MAVDTDELKRRGWRQTAVSLPIFAALLFVPAGTLRYWQGWLYAFVFIAGCAVISVYFTRHDPALIERRMKIGPAKEREPAQKIIITLMLIGFPLLFVVSGLDVRWHWSAVPLWLVIVANGMIGRGFRGVFRGAQAEQLCGLHHHGRAGAAGDLHRRLRRSCATRCMQAHCCW